MSPSERDMQSDALQALVAELVQAEDQVEEWRAAEDEARQQFVAARQALDAALARTKAAVARRDMTDQALTLIAKRDEVSDATLERLTARTRA